MNAAAERIEREARLHAIYADTLEAFGESVVGMARALRDDDGILGAISGIGVAENGPRLPAHIRHALIEALSDEAARSAVADDLYAAGFGDTT